MLKRYLCFRINASSIKIDLIKQLTIFALILSIGLNVYFLIRKVKRIERNNEIEKLYYYKEISHKEGFDFFLKQIQNRYPQTISKKYFIVYTWDSIMFDFTNKDQMKTLDSIAASFGKSKLEYVFATEMEKTTSENFLKRNQEDFKNVKMLYGMNDFISGIYSIKDIKINKPKHIDGLWSAKIKEKYGIDICRSKQKPLYLIIDSLGKVLYKNENKFIILKDTIFLNTLNVLAPKHNSKILN